MTQAKKNPTPATSPASAPTPPAGMTKRGADIDGFWDGKGAIHFIPSGAKLFDSKLDKSRASILIVGEVVSPCSANAKDDDGTPEDITLAPGDTVGVWGKAGMRAISTSAFVKVWMRQIGEKDVGKAKPMKVYDVFSEDGGSRLPIIEDRRDHSAGSETFLDSPTKSVRGKGPRPASSDNDDVPLDANGKPIF